MWKAGLGRPGPELRRLGTSSRDARPGGSRTDGKRLASICELRFVTGTDPYSALDAFLLEDVHDGPAIRPALVVAGLIGATKCSRSTGYRSLNDAIVGRRGQR